MGDYDVANFVFNTCYITPDGSQKYTSQELSSATKMKRRFGKTKRKTTTRSNKEENGQKI